MRSAAALALIGSVLLVGSPARAQDDQEQALDTPAVEGPDPTRLDVERLPPEAIEVTRDLYSHGIYVEGWLGVRGFRNGIGRVSDPGLWASVGIGCEVFSWLWLRAVVEGSIHATDAPPPPSPTAFELLGALAELRLQLNLSARAALWLGAEGGIVYATGDVLRAYGFDQSADVSLQYGGSLGFDWHMVNRHHSIGLLGGARLYPSLGGVGPGKDRAVGIHGAAYVRYVF